MCDTYAADSNATTKNKLVDPYVKAFRWASDRIGEEGVVAFVSNNSFLDSIAADGMRKRLRQDFDRSIVLDLGGNVRKNPKLSGTTHNVFGIQVGVSINFWSSQESGTRIAALRSFLCRLMSSGRGTEDELLDKLLEHRSGVAGTFCSPMPSTAGSQMDYVTILRSFVPLASTASRRRQTIFDLYSNGVQPIATRGSTTSTKSFLKPPPTTTIDFYNQKISRSLEARKPCL